MAYLRQASFAGGEISPTLQGRSDVAKYHSALARCRNLIPSRHGTVTTRPPLEFIAQTGTSPRIVAGGAVGVRLIPFVASSTGFLLVFGHHSITIFKNGVQQDQIAGAGSVPYEVEDLAHLKFAQLGNVMTLCHPAHEPYELTRVSDTDWRLDRLDTAPPAASFGSGNSLPAVEGSAATVTVYPQGGVALSPSVLFAQNDYIKTEREGGLSTLSGGLFEYSTGTSYPSYQSLLPLKQNHVNWELDTTHTPREWVWQVTSIVRNADGSVTESAPYTVTKRREFGYPIYSSTTTYALDAKVSIDRWSGAYFTSKQAGNLNHSLSDAAWWEPTAAPAYPSNRRVNAETTLPLLTICAEDLPVTLSWSLDNWTYPVGTAWRYVGWNIYRGLRGQDMGLVGYLDATQAQSDLSLVWTDYGAAPDYTQVPPSGYNPMKVYNGAGTLVATEYPSVVTFFEQRRIFGNLYASATGGRPGWILGSKQGDYNNFDKAAIQTAEDMFEFELASQRFEEIRSLLPVSKLLAFTSAGEWAIGGNGGSLAFDNVDTKVQGTHGSSWLDPLLIDNEALYVQERGPHIQSLVFDFGSQSWTGDELNVFADHLLDGHTILAWAWAHQPYHAVFMVRDDGVMLSMTYHREQNVNAWAWHDMADGSVFLDVCVVPESGQDVVYCICQRGNPDTTQAVTPVVTLERFADWNPLLPDVTAHPALDCCYLQQYPHPAGLLVSKVVVGTPIANGDLVDIGNTSENVWLDKEGAPTYWWDEGVAFQTGDWCVYGAAVYRALQASTGVLPTNGSYWTYFTQWQSFVTYSVGTTIYVGSPTLGTAVAYRATVESTNNYPPDNLDKWQVVPQRPLPVVVVGTRADGSSVTFTVGANGTGRQSATALRAVVSGLTSTLPHGTVLTSWRRTRTQCRVAGLAATTRTSALGTAIIFNSDGSYVGLSGVSLTTTSLTVNGTDIRGAAVGLPFTQQFAQLPPASESKELRTLFGTLARMTIEALAFGAVSVGQDFEHTLQQKAVPPSTTSPLAASQTLVEIRPAARWKKGALGVMQQSLPLPITVLSSIREIEFEGS